MISAEQTSHVDLRRPQEGFQRHDFLKKNKHKIHSCILDSRPGGKGEKSPRDKFNRE